MSVYIVDPLVDPRWDTLLLKHPRAGVFHTRGWLSALHETYGYTPVVLTSSAPGAPLENGLLFCDVRSYITGGRLVSLPFSDHCDPLVDSVAEQAGILADVREHIGREGFKYAEVRPLSAGEPKCSATIDLRPSEKFYLHVLSLGLPRDTLLRNMHKDSIQRKIRRAEREELTYEKGRSDSLLRKFYQLLLRTRRRHCLPPQPLQWFRNLIAFMGDQLTIRVASIHDRPVAAILTLSFKDTITYKYGCSDERFHHLGGTPFLFWKTIQEAKDQGMNQLDLGRSDVDNAGLVHFKDRLGAKRMDLTYYRLLPSKAQSAKRIAQSDELGSADAMRFAPCAMRPEGPRAAGINSESIESIESVELLSPGQAGSEPLRKAQSAWRRATAPKMRSLLKRLVRYMPDRVLAAAGRILYRHIG